MNRPYMIGYSAVIRDNPCDCPFSTTTRIRTPLKIPSLEFFKSQGKQGNRKGCSYIDVGHSRQGNRRKDCTAVKGATFP